MDCEEYQRQVSKLLDNALNEGKMPEVFRHLGGCDECRAFFQSSMNLRQAMQSAAPMDVSETIDEGVLGSAASRPPFVSSVATPTITIRSQSTRVSVRTIVLAMLVLIIGCAMFSTTLSIDTQGMSPGPTASQSMQGNGVR